MTLLPFDHYVGPHEQIRAVCIRIKSDLVGITKREIQSTVDDDSRTQSYSDERAEIYRKLLPLIGAIEGALEDLEILIINQEKEINEQNNDESRDQVELA